MPRPPRSTLFPYTTLFRSRIQITAIRIVQIQTALELIGQFFQPARLDELVNESDDQYRLRTLIFQYVADDIGMHLGQMYEFIHAIPFVQQFGNTGTQTIERDTIQIGAIVMAGLDA